MDEMFTTAVVTERSGTLKDGFTVKLKFAGEDEARKQSYKIASLRQYYSSSTTYKTYVNVGDRVLLVNVSGTWIVLGVIS